MKKILIIEDDLDIQELIQFFLEDQGYEVITASDGIDGIAVFLKEQIDLILLDILLPKMDGYAVCELIRKESEVPIIMISALGREEDQIKGFEMQIDDYIPKPISLPIMIKKIETSVYKGYKQDKIEMRGDRAEMSDFPLYLNMVVGGLDCRDQAIGGFSFVVKIYAVPVVEIIG